jgi:hypothetical protein
MTRRRGVRRAGRQGRSTGRAIELAIAAPAVMTTRTLRMLAAGATPNAADRREMLRMGSEKVEAFGAAYIAMAVEMQRQQLAWWVRTMRSLWLAPWSSCNRTATANARRLHRAPRR